MYVSKTRKRRQMRSRSGCGRRLITVSRRFARARAWSSGDSSSSARRPRSSSGPRPSRSRASTATTTARSTPASGCSERSSFPARPGHQGIDRTRPGHQGRPAARARLRMYIASSLTPLTHMNRMITYKQLAFTGREHICCIGRRNCISSASGLGGKPCRGLPRRIRQCSR